MLFHSEAILKQKLLIPFRKLSRFTPQSFFTCLPLEFQILIFIQASNLMFLIFRNEALALAHVLLFQVLSFSKL